LPAGGAHIPARGEHKAVLLDFRYGGAIAESGNVAIGFCHFPIFPPGVDGAGDFDNVVIGEYAIDPGGHGSKLAGVNKQGFASSILPPAGLVVGEKPEADRNGRAQEQLPWQRHHHLNHVPPHHGLTDFPFATGVGTHGAVGQHHPCFTTGSQFPEDVLQPGGIGVAHRWPPIHPARIVVVSLPTPVGNIERGIGEDGVELAIRVLITGKGVGRFLTQISGKPANRQVHCRQPPGGGIAFLSIDGDVVTAAAVTLHEPFALHKHSP